MTFKTQLATDLTTFFNANDFAETVSYTAVGAVAANITAIVSRNAPLQEPYVRGPATATCEITVKKSQVTSPQYGDLFTIDSQTWEFDPDQGVIYEDDQVYEIALRRVD